MLCLYLSNIKSHVLNFNVVRDYFVIKQNKKQNKTKPKHHYVALV